MSLKFYVLVGFSVGSIIGGYIPTFFGASFFSYWSVIGNGIGGLAGIYIGYKWFNR